MLADQIIPIKATEQPKETTIRYATIEQLRMLMKRIEHSYAQAEVGKVLLASICEDITLMIPVEKTASIKSIQATVEKEN
jgi:hypothetical protein